MLSTTSPARAASRADFPSNSNHHTSAGFARQMTLSAFGWKNGKALDQADFLDRPPGQFPVPVPEARR